MKLFAHQQEVVDQNKARLGLFHSPGLGKTITLLELAKKNNVKALIICPKSIKKQWQEYIDEYKASHVVMTKEEFRRDNKEVPEYEAVIVDEVHHFSNTKSILTKSLLWYFKKHNTKYRWLATGTPYRSSPMNIYALGILLGYNWNYWKFFSQFFMIVPMGARRVPVAIKGKEDELEEYVRQIGVTLAMDDVAIVPEQRTTKIEIDLTGSQIMTIKALEEPIPIARFTKIHCIEQGFSYGDEYITDAFYDSNKIEHIISICKEYKNVAIVARYTLQISMYQRILSKEFPKRHIFIISGSVSDRFKVVKDINKTKECIVLIQSACSEGYELPTIQAMVFASLDWSFVNYQQMCARILRINALKENHYYHLVVKGIDERVYKTIMAHKDFHQQLYTL